MAQLRAEVVRSLPHVLASVAAPPPAGEWRCVERTGFYLCGGGTQDSLTVRIDSIIEDRDAREARVFLVTFGRSATHFGPGMLQGFEARWTDTYRRSGTAWQRVARRVNLIT